MSSTDVTARDQSEPTADQGQNGESAQSESQRRIIILTPKRIVVKWSTDEVVKALKELGRRLIVFVLLVLVQLAIRYWPQLREVLRDLLTQ